MAALGIGQKWTRITRRIALQMASAVFAAAMGPWVVGQEETGAASMGASLKDLNAVKRRAAFNRVQQQYYDRAVLHLRENVDRVQKGAAVDLGRLDEALEEMEFVISHNPIQESSRVRLIRDLGELRKYREHLSR